MTCYIGNAFSLGMLDNMPSEGVTLKVIPFTLELAQIWTLTFSPVSCVGHADTAELISALLDVPIAMNRVSTSLAPGDKILVAQYNGPRLPEGAKALPEGAKIRWMRVEVMADIG